MRKWSPGWDLTSIPDELFAAEKARRFGTIASALNQMRKTHAGAAVWPTHHPDNTRCRCVKCNAKRTKRRAASALLPKRPRGRPKGTKNRKRTAA